MRTSSLKISDYSFAIRCGGNTSLISAADKTVYEPDYADLEAASYYVSGTY
jgi:hypothetical protein